MGGQKSRGFRKDAIQAVAEMEQVRKSLTEKRRTDIALEKAAASGCRKCQSELQSGMKNDWSHDHGCPRKRFQKVRQIFLTCVEDQPTPSMRPEEVKPGKSGSSDWSETEDAELTKLVNKHGNSWRDCLDDSTIFQEKYKHISDESARDRLRSRWRTIRKNTIDWSKQDYTEEDVRKEITRQVAEHGTDWKHILAVSSRESRFVPFLRSHHLLRSGHSFCCNQFYKIAIGTSQRTQQGIVF